MVNVKRRRWGILLTTALVLHVSGCGTLLHPERKGQTGGKVDAKIAILDGIGLLFFIIPGVIAFIVDFDNGTIYLPGSIVGDLVSERDGVPLPATMEAAGWTAVNVGAGRLDAAAVREVVGRHTGQWIELNDPNLRITTIPSSSGPSRGFAEGTR